MPPEDADIGRIVGHARSATPAGYVKRLGAPASDLSDDQLASTRGIRAPGWPRTGASGARPQAGAGSAGGLDRRVVRVTRAISEVRGQLVIGRPKSEAGKCTVALPEAIVPVLRTHLDTYSERGHRGRVFVGEKGATTRRGNFQAMWAKAIKAAGLPKGFHFHDLRHTGNTWAADSGASLRDLMDRMGHRSMRAALIYMHANKGASRAIAAGIDRQLSAAAKKPKGRGRDGASGT